MAYRTELRKKILEYIKKGHSAYQAAEVFGVSKSTIYSWLQREDIAPILNHTKGYKVDNKILDKMISEQKDILLRELSEKLGVSIAAVSKRLIKLGYTNKKNSKICRSKEKSTD